MSVDAQHLMPIPVIDARACFSGLSSSLFPHLHALVLARQGTRMSLSGTAAVLRAWPAISSSPSRTASTPWHMEHGKDKNKRDCQREALQSD